MSYCCEHGLELTFNEASKIIDYHLGSGFGVGIQGDKLVRKDYCYHRDYDLIEPWGIREAVEFCIERNATYISEVDRSDESDEYYLELLKQDAQLLDEILRRINKSCGKLS